MSIPELLGITPSIALPGGLVHLECQLADSDPSRIKVRFGSQTAHPQGVSRQSILVRVPAGASSCEVRVEDNDKPSNSKILTVGSSIASELHPVASPAVDKSGVIYTTLSGPRGESVPFSVFRIDLRGNKEPYLSDIINATGLAFGPDGKLYVSSRHTGMIYRVEADREIEKHAEGLGIATGMAFGPNGVLYVGDRGGFVYRIEPTAKLSVLCELEPSVSAYHLAVDPEGNILVSGPTLSAQDAIYRVTPEGKVSVFLKGFGRPQGLAFYKGDLYLAASYRGRKGVFRVNGRREIDQIIAAPILVGVAFGPRGEMILADSSSVYRIDRN